MKTILATLIVGALGVVFAISEDDGDQTPDVRDEYGQPFFPTGASADENYSKILQEAGETTLWKPFPIPDSPIGKQIRLTIRPSFGKPMVLRMHQRGEHYFVTVRRLSGSGGFGIGYLELRGTVKIPKGNFSALWAMANTSTVRNLAKVTDTERDALRGLDGTSWCLEVAEGDEHLFIDLWSPHALLAKFDEIVELSPVKIGSHLSKEALTEFTEVAKWIVRFGDVGFSELIELPTDEIEQDEAPDR